MKIVLLRKAPANLDLKTLDPSQVVHLKNNLANEIFKKL